jgi:ribosomal protein S18 acetylase RimI-like enzyme
MSDGVRVRRATLDDVEVIARHRAAMFADMGTIAPADAGPLIEATRPYLRTAIPAGDYLGWLVGLEPEPHRIVAGAGLVLRRVPPFPTRGADGAIAIAEGREGLVLNVYVEPECRRRGLARRLMDEVIAYARANALDRLVLHASDDGRPLYEQLGFKPTNEMRMKAR